MRQRARILDLRTSLDDMGSVLTYLPFPETVHKLITASTGLVDVSASSLYQNIGFLVNGDFQSFLSLYQNVRARTGALNWMRVIFPEIGSLGKTPSLNDTLVTQLFVNANVKQGSGGQTVYQICSGADTIVQRLNSAGFLHSVIEGTTAYTTTGWAIPGSGFGGVGSVRSWVPNLCRWKGASDAMISRTTASTSYSVSGFDVTLETVQDGPLAANLAHEYNLNFNDTAPANAYGTFNYSTGSVSATDALAAEDTRYRVSKGFGLAQLSYKYDANQMQYMASLLA
jgi:hypothetical protein